MSVSVASATGPNFNKIFECDATDEMFISNLRQSHVHIRFDFANQFIDQANFAAALRQMVIKLCDHYLGNL